MTLKQFNPEETIRMVQKLTDDFFMRRMAAWKQHNKICERRGIPAVPWEDFKKVVLRAHVEQTTGDSSLTLDKMVGAGVAQAVKMKEKRDKHIQRTFVPFKSA
jgi:hypothetical protein